MKRRDFLRTTTFGVAAAGVAAASFPKPAISQGNRELRMVTSWPKGFPGLGTAAQRYAQRVSDMTGGRITIKEFAGGELVHPLKVHDAVQEGSADIYHSADYYFQGKSPAYAFFTSVPGGLAADEMHAWMFHGGGWELWDELGAQFGIKHFPGGNTGHQMGGWFGKEINSLDDLKGLKMRIPGLGGAMIKALGGTSVTLAGSEILPALQSGTIDAAEWVGPWNDLAFGFYKVTKNYYFPGFHEPGPVLGMGISMQVWESLSKEDQAIIQNAGVAELGYDLAEFDANNLAALQTLVEKHDVKLHEFSDEISKAVFEAAADVVADAGNSDPFTKKVYDSYNSFRKNALEWTRISNQAYFNKRAL